MREQRLSCREYRELTAVGKVAVSVTTDFGPKKQEHALETRDAG